MGKIIIIEEKANQICDKLERMKRCVEDIMDCFSESMRSREHTEYMRYDDDYDEEEDYFPRKRKSNYKSSRY